MNLFFKNSLLGTSCVIISLSLSHPAISMDRPEDDHKPPMPTKSIIHPVPEDQKESYFVTTEFGNQKFDHESWVKDLLKEKTNEDKVKRFFQVLDMATDDGDEHALKHLHTFSTCPFLGMNKVNEEKADQALKSGCRREQPWVVEVYQKKIQGLNKESEELKALKRAGSKIANFTEKQAELLNLHRDVANNQLCSPKFPNFVQQSESFLEFLFPFNGVQWFQSYVTGRSQETFAALLGRLKKYGYYKHYEQIYMMMQGVEVKQRSCRSR
jgi:Fe-S-cluster containining protein